MEHVDAGGQPVLKEPPTIAGLAQSCLEAFQKCLDKASDVHPREVTLVENQIARFSVWAANIGVFASGRASLDHRLREAPDVQDTVGGLLEALEIQALRCLDVLDSIRSQESKESLKEIDLSLDQILTEISGEISLLHKFSNTIRRASKEVHKQKAARSFRILDEEGNGVEEFLEELFLGHIRDQFPGVSETIQQRLAKTMLLRRKRILYRRSRYGSKPTRNQAQPTPPIASKPSIRIGTEQSPPQGVDQEVSAAQEKAPVDNTAKSAVRSTAMTATTLAPDYLKKSSTPSVVSMSKTVALSSHDSLRFPPAPCGGLLRKYNKLKARSKNIRPVVINHTAEDAGEGSKITFGTSVQKTEVSNEEIRQEDWEECVAAVGEIICPFCFCALPVVEVVNDKKWKEHVKGDLDPYVCLLEDCDSGEELYTHSSTWLKHMREHTLKWKCKSKLHSPFDASSKQDYLNHMREVHSGKFNDAQLGVLADKNCRAAGQLFQTCPLCGKFEVNGSMEDHVVGHMRFIALKSLPSYEEDVGAQSDLDDSHDDGSTATAHSRSTLKAGFGSVTGSESSSWSDDTGKAVDVAARGYGHQDATSEEDSSHVFMDGGRTLTNSAYEQNFSKIPARDWRHFEWGFIIANNHGSPNDSDNDSTLKAFGRALEKMSNGQLATEEWQNTTVIMDPDCAVCHAPATLACDCEARGLDVAVAQAEERMMGPMYEDIRSWVLARSRESIRRMRKLDQEGVDSRASGEEGNSVENSPNAHPPETTKTRSQNQTVRYNAEEETWKTQDAGTKGDVKTFTQSSTSETAGSPQVDVNQQWRQTLGSYSKVLDYYFSLVHLTIPPDDQISIMNLRWSDLGQRKYERKPGETGTFVENNDMNQEMLWLNPFKSDPHKPDFTGQRPLSTRFAPIPSEMGSYVPDSHFISRTYKRDHDSVLD